MSRATPQRDTDDRDSWEELAEHVDALRICIEEETAFEEQARHLMDELDKRGLL